MSDRPWLYFDVQAVQTPDNPDRGIARYVREQARALEAADRDHAVQFVYNPRLATGPRLDGIVDAGRLAANLYDGPGGVVPEDAPFLYYVGSPFEERIGADDIWPRWARATHALTAVTLYDLIPMRFPDVYLSSRRLRESYEARLGLVRNADLVLAISASTAKDATELLDVAPERVVTIGAGVSDFWKPPKDRADVFRRLKAAFPELRPGFLFFTGGIDFRKNMEGILHGFAALAAPIRAEHPLVVTCKMDPGAERGLRALARALGIANDVLFTNYISDDVLRGFYQTTDLFVFPSLYEGFGLPLVEAIACGAPAVASDCSSMPEIVTLPEARFDPRSPASIAATVTAALSDESLARRLRSLGPDIRKRFSWSGVAERTLDACRRTRESARPSPSRRPLRPSRPALALFTPFPPQPSGVADYSLRLVRALTRFADVDVFVDGPSRFFEPIARSGARILNRATFELLDALGSYDEVVYAMGNSEFHAFAYDALRRRSGVVLAHEIRFTGLYSWYGAHRSANPRFFADALRTECPNAPLSLGEKRFVTPEEADEFGVLLVTELLERSTRFLVHSRFAAEIVRERRPDLAARVQEVRFAVEAPFPAWSPATSPRPPLVSTFGIVSPVKRIELFLRAAPLVLARVPDARFAIVGAAQPEYEAHLRAMAAALGVADRVEVTGRVDVREYEERLKRTTCAVQLRASTNGESSAAVGDCLRAALPTIATHAGPVREFPPGTVFLIGREASEAELAAAIVTILTDEDVARAFSERALSFARHSSFDAAAESLLRAVIPGFSAKDAAAPSIS